VIHSVTPRRCLGRALPLLVSAALTSCGSDNLDTAKVTGTVTFDGKPIPGAGVTFSPVAGEGAGGNTGKPASATTAQDGTYSLTTYEDGDGAVIGRHQVSFSPPPAPGTDTEEADPGDAHAPPPKPSPYAGLKPKETEVEVKEGDNTINIELVKGS
jgi:hypothetical protein